MGIPGVFVLVQKHYCECVHSHLLSPSFGGGLDEAVEAVCYLVTFHLSADDSAACFGPGLSGRKI